MAIVDSDLLGNTSLTEKVKAMLEAAKVAEADLHCTFDWDGNTEIPCVGGPQFFGKVLDIAGWKRVRRVKIKLRMDSLPFSGRTDRPAENQTVLYRADADDPGTRYRIIGIKIWFNALMELECEDPNNS
jgi:hypothetical protein